MGLDLKDGAGDGDVTGMGLPHPGIKGIIHILKVSLLYHLVLGTKTLGLVSLLVVISQCMENVLKGTSESLAIWVLVMSPFSTSKMALYFVSSMLVFY